MTPKALMKFETNDLLSSVTRTPGPLNNLLSHLTSSATLGKSIKSFFYNTITHTVMRARMLRHMCTSMYTLEYKTICR